MSAQVLILFCVSLIALVSTGMVVSLALSWTALVVLLALALVPLALLAPGLWRGRVRSYRIASIVSIFYVGFALMETIARPAQRWLPGLLLLAATALITLCIVAIRQSAVRRWPAAPDE
jgi:uncharacterized membrane protein